MTKSIESSDNTSTTTTSITAEEAALELVSQYPQIVTAEAYFHERNKVMVVSVWVTDFDVMLELPKDSEGKYKGFEIIWGKYIPDDVIIQ